jgi:hypothetical protein
VLKKAQQTIDSRVFAFNIKNTDFCNKENIDSLTNFIKLNSNSNEPILGSLYYKNIQELVQPNQLLNLEVILQFFCYLNTEAKKKNSKTIYYYYKPVFDDMKGDICFEDEKNLLEYECIYFVYYSLDFMDYALIHVEYRTGQISIHYPLTTNFKFNVTLGNSMNYIAKQINKVENKNCIRLTNFVSYVGNNVPQTDQKNCGLFICIMAFHNLNTKKENNNQIYFNYFRLKILFAFIELLDDKSTYESLRTPLEFNDCNEEELCINDNNTNNITNVSKCNQDSQISTLSKEKKKLKIMSIIIVIIMISIMKIFFRLKLKILSLKTKNV